MFFLSEVSEERSSAYVKNTQQCKCNFLFVMHSSAEKVFFVVVEMKYAVA